jgi:biopolymer transport protein TolQ
MSLTFFSVISNSSLFFKFSIFLLIVILVWEWGLFIEKFGIFKLKVSLSESFRREFNSGEMLDKIYNRLAEKKKIYSPLARVFFAGMRELNMSNIRNIDFSARYADNIKRNIRDRIYSSMAIERSKIITELRSDIPNFLVIASISPFIGLLGTVWEIMATFYSLNTYKVVNLSLVIPGIAQSMFSSILAILVAVFSVFFYNFLITKVNNFIEETEVFAHELTNILARELDMLTNNASKRALQERKSAVSDDDDDDDI